MEAVLAFSKNSGIIVCNLKNERGVNGQICADSSVC